MEVLKFRFQAAWFSGVFLCFLKKNSETTYQLGPAKTLGTKWVNDLLFICVKGPPFLTFTTYRELIRPNYMAFGLKDLNRAHLAE